MKSIVKALAPSKDGFRGNSLEAACQMATAKTLNAPDHELNLQVTSFCVQDAAITDPRWVFCFMTLRGSVLNAVMLVDATSKLRIARSARAGGTNIKYPPLFPAGGLGVAGDSEFYAHDDCSVCELLIRGKVPSLIAFTAFRRFCLL
jgi:hypothetical protein